MLKKILYALVLAAVTLSAPSCKKWLNLQPQDGITGQKFWKTKEQVQAAVIGCYSSLLGATGGADRALSEYLFWWGELRADMITPAPGAFSQELDVINVNILPSNPLISWRAVYKTINFCNTVIDFAPQALQNDKTFTQAALDGYVAEAKALRALMYFYLVRSFGEVPLKITSTTSDEDLVQLTKSTQQEVLTQVLKDLSEAEPGAVFTYGSQASDKGRITKYTIYAIQADVYLWMDKYNECIAACNKVINSARFGLIAGNNALFPILFAQGNSNEGIFEFQFDQQKPNVFFPMLMTASRRFFASPLVMDEMYTVDYFDDTKRDLRGDGTSVRATDGVIWKYVGANSTQERTAQDSYAHWFVYRYADILLMKAEALALTNKGQEALNIVYQVRTRARALAATDKNPDPLDVNAVTDFILEERAREFAFEGKRWYDVLRHAKRNNYARIELMLNMVANSVPSDRQQSAIAKLKDHNSHYFPIFEYELQTDKNLVQNPFYK